MTRQRRSFCKCGAIKKKGENCEKCKPTKAPAYRTTTQRGYGYDWQQLSKAYRAENPLCEDCLEKGRTTPTSEVHHRIPIDEDQTLRLEWSNLRGLCEDCHHIRHTKGIT